MNRPDDYDLYIEEGMQEEEARYYEEMEHLNYIEDVNLAITGLEEMSKIIEKILVMDKTNTKTEEDIKDLKRHYKMAIKALKEQLPTKHIEDSYETVNGGFLGVVPMFRCGKCENEICYGVSRCCHCGQRLDWSE